MVNDLLMKGQDMSQIEFTPYNPKYLQAYVDLNRQWIEKYFAIEPMDIAQLERPHENILDHGGEIFFLLENQEPIATCAMVPHGHGCYELAKMAVNPKVRGKGYGDLLMEKSLDWAKKKGAEKVILLSNTILEPAISLYKKHGFITTHLGSHPDYKRCNIEMEYLIRT